MNKKLLISLCAAMLAVACGPVKDPAFTGILSKSFDGLDAAQFAAQYTANAAQWQAAWEFLSREDLDTLAAGKYVLTEEGAYANIQEYDIDPEKEKRFEAHRAFIDIQYVIGGQETIYVCRPEQLGERLTDYSETADIEFFTPAEEMDGYVMDKSNFVILFPSDPHLPGCPVENGDPHVRKVVVKVPFFTE